MLRSRRGKTWDHNRNHASVVRHFSYRRTFLPRSLLYNTSYSISSTSSTPSCSSFTRRKKKRKKNSKNTSKLQQWHVIPGVRSRGKTTTVCREGTLVVDDIVVGFTDGVSRVQLREIPFRTHNDVDSSAPSGTHVTGMFWKVSFCHWFSLATVIYTLLSITISFIFISLPVHAFFLSLFLTFLSLKCLY